MSDTTRWLLAHVVMALAIPITAGVILTGGIVGAITGQGPPAPQLTAYALLLGYLVVGLFAFYGYYADAQALEAHGSPWVPSVWIWFALHIVLTPFLASPLYLLRRWRAVGISWGGLVGRPQSAGSGA